jgi:hypothetical protein
MIDEHRILFVGGLHRSGTTPVARWIAQHPDVSAFGETGVAEDEGQHLQDVYPPATAHGGPGRFAFDDGAHLTESSPLVSEESRRRVWSAWSPHWDLERPVLLEKSPPNLVRMRFLQALFPDHSYFLAVVRHPIAVAYATKRWSRAFGGVPPRFSRRLPALQAGVHSLIRHWVEAHERFLADARFLDHVTLIRYEDIVEDCPGELARIFRFSGLGPVEDRWEVKAALNDRYIRRWSGGFLGSVKRPYLARLEREFEDRVRPFGYSLSAPDEMSPPAPDVANLMRG